MSDFAAESLQYDDNKTIKRFHTRIVLHHLIKGFQWIVAKLQ